MLRTLLALTLVVSYSAIADLDLESLPLKDLCDGKVKRLTYDRDHRSADLFCNVTAPADLLNHKSKKKGKVVSEKVFLEKHGGKFRDIYYNFNVVSNSKWGEPQYKEYTLDGELIGVRGYITADDGKGAKGSLGAYFTLDKKGKIKDVAKVYVIDRSDVVKAKVPADLKDALSVFEKSVRPEKVQDMWLLNADVVRLQGKDVFYGTTNMLWDVAQGLGEIGLYSIAYEGIKKVDNYYKFLTGQTVGEKNYGSQFCENLIDKDGKPIDVENLDDAKIQARCEELTNTLVKDMSKPADGKEFPKFSHASLLYVSLDEEEKGYLLIPSKEEQDSYLKVFFDISHNE